MLIICWNTKKLADVKLNVPSMVILDVAKTKTCSEKVTVNPAGIIVEQTADGIRPSCHVAASENEPSAIAVQIEVSIGIAVAASDVSTTEPSTEI